VFARLDKGIGRIEVIVGDIEGPRFPDAI